MTIKAYTSYNERTNTRGYWNFTIEDELPELGDDFHGEEVRSVDEIEPDIQNNDDVFNYDYYRITATMDGEFNPDDDIMMEYYIAIAKGV